MPTTRPGSDGGEDELPVAVALLFQSGRIIDTIRMDGWRVDVGYPEERDAAGRRLSDADVWATKRRSTPPTAGQAASIVASESIMGRARW